MRSLTSWHHAFILLIAGVLLIDAIQIHLYSSPLLVTGLAEFPGKVTEGWTHPPYQKVEKGLKSKYILRETIYLPTWFPTTFKIYPQDILWTIKVNGHELRSPNLPLAVTHNEGHTFDLGPYLHPGLNDLEFGMEVLWGTTSMHVYVSSSDWTSLLTFFFISIGVCLIIFSLNRLSGISFHGQEYSALCGGILLMFAYMSSTPFFIRAYDFDGHIAYIDYVANNLSLPKANLGWETFQPPGYYVILGCLTRGLGAEKWNLEQRSTLWQICSWLCMSGALVAVFAIGRLAFTQPSSRCNFLALTTVIPSFVFNASRISNDVLFNLSAFWWFAALLWAWQRPSFARIGLMLFILNLALITKANGLILLLSTLSTLALNPRLTIRGRSHVIALTVLACSCGAGWYYLDRLYIEHRPDQYIVGNIQQLNPKSHLDDVFWNSLVFNPIKILEYPFVRPWGPRHEFFFEYFFKSAFLGEWWLSHPYIWAARLFMVSSLCLLGAIAYQLLFLLRRPNWDSVPSIVTITTLIILHWSFVQFAPFMSSQDFRYSLVLIAPLFLILIQNRKPNQFLPHILVFSQFNCVAYLAYLCMS